MRIKYYLRGIGCGIIFSVIIMSIALSNKGKNEISDAEVIQRAKQLGMIDANDTQLEEKGDSDQTAGIESDTETEIPLATEKESEKVNISGNTSEKKTDNNVGAGTINALTHKDSVSTNKNEQGSENKEGNNGTENKNGTENNNGTENKNGTESNKENESNKGNKKDVNEDSSTIDNNQKGDKLSASANEHQNTEFVSFTIRSGQVCRQIAENLKKQGLVDDADAFREYMARKGLASSIRCGTFDLPKGATYQELAKYLTTR